MRKPIEPNREKLRELRVGMTFSNLNELSRFVDLPITNQTGYQILMREFVLLKAGVEIEREGHKIVITAINLKE